MAERSTARSRALVLTAVMILSVIAVPFGPVGTVSAAQEINSCGTIDQPGTYHLTANVSNDATCINITVGDVVFDGMGHTVLGLDTENQNSDVSGILVDSGGTIENVTVRNVTVSEWSAGLTVTSVNDAIVRDVTATQNFHEGILVRYAKNETVRDNTVLNTKNDPNPDSTSYGIVFVSENGTVRNNTISGTSGEGIRIVRDNNTIVNNTITNSNQSGIYLISSNDNVVRHNSISNSNIDEDTGHAGVEVEGDDNLVHNNTVVESYHRGIQTVGINNTFFDNTVADTVGDWTRDDHRFHGWDVQVTNPGNSFVKDAGNATFERLNIGNSTAPNTTLSFVGENILVRGNDSTQPGNSNATSIGRFFDVNEINDWWDEGYFDFQIHYRDSDVSAVDESALRIWKYNASGWIEVTGSSVDTTNNTVGGTISSSGESWDIDPSASKFGAYESSTAGTSANFAVTIDATNSPVDEGETLTVDATIENSGDVNGTQTVNLSVNGAVRDSSSVTIASGENSTVTLSWATSDGDAGDYTVNVTSENDSASVAVTVDSTSTGSSSGSSSSGGTGDTATSTSTPTATATAIPTTTPTASPTPVQTATPEPTSSPTTSPAATDTATATAEPTPSPTATETPGQPGFGLLTAALAVALFGLSRRRRD